MGEAARSGAASGQSRSLVLQESRRIDGQRDEVANVRLMTPF